MRTLLDNIIFVDGRTNDWFLSLHNTLIDSVFICITTLGEAVFVIILALIISFILWHLRERWQIAVMWIAIAGSEITTFIIKWSINRPRPSGALIVESSASFPSGHATIAIAFYGFLTYLLLREIKKYRALTLAISVIIILAIGLSRLYLCVHYLSDVLVGYLIGAVWLMIGIKINKLKSNNDKI